jgi:hypothetical protein
VHSPSVPIAFFALQSDVGQEKPHVRCTTNRAEMTGINGAAESRLRSRPARDAAVTGKNVPQSRHFVDDRLSLRNKFLTRLELSFAFRKGPTLFPIGACLFLSPLFRCPRQGTGNGAACLHGSNWRERLATAFATLGLEALLYG